MKKTRFFKKVGHSRYVDLEDLSDIEDGGRGGIISDDSSWDM